MKPSSYILFARNVKGKGWSKRHIRRKFLKQVDKEDYAKSELYQILKYLFVLGKKGQICPPREIYEK